MTPALTELALGHRFGGKLVLPGLQRSGVGPWLHLERCAELRANTAERWGAWRLLPLAKTLGVN